MTFSMAMLRGLKGVRSIVISQIAAHADVPFFTQRMLAYLRATNLMKLVGVRLLSNARATRKRTSSLAASMSFLRFLYPMHFDDRTRSVTSRELLRLDGPILDRLDQLNEPTLHDDARNVRQGQCVGFPSARSDRAARPRRALRRGAASCAPARSQELGGPDIVRPRRTESGLPAKRDAQTMTALAEGTRPICTIAS